MGSITRVSRTIRATPAVYKAFLDPNALTAWRAPDNMTAHIIEFDHREGGSYSMSLVYKDPSQSPGGKTSEDTDTFTGRFLELVPNRKIVELIDFESSDPSFAGQMKMTSTLTETQPGTEVTILCEDIPPGRQRAGLQTLPP